LAHQVWQSSFLTSLVTILILRCNVMKSFPTQGSIPCDAQRCQWPSELATLIPAAKKTV